MFHELVADVDAELLDFNITKLGMFQLFCVIFFDVVITYQICYASSFVSIVRYHHPSSVGFDLILKIISVENVVPFP